MNRRWVTLLGCVLFGAAGFGAILAQAPAATPAGEDLQGIHAALVRIADALERQEGNQAVELLIKRIEVHEKRLEPIQRRLAEAEQIARQAESDFKRIERMRADMERTLRSQADAGQSGGPGDGMRPMLQELDKQVEVAQGQFETEQLRLKELERQMDEGRKAIDVLDEELDDVLAR